MLRFGLRAHDFGRLPAEALAEKLEGYGPACVQLAPTKAFPDIIAEKGYLNSAYARRIRDIFARRDMAISVLGCYINPVHPDRGERERQLLRFEEHLRFAGDFGCAVVGTETGSLNADCSFNPATENAETFDRLCESVERLVAVAERYGSVVGIEPVADQHTLSSVEKAQTLIERIDSPALKIIFDPVNLIPRSGLGESQEAFFKRSFEAFGPKIAVVHAKDFLFEEGRKSGPVTAGLGVFDFEAFFRILQIERPGIDVLLENAGPETASAAMRRLAMIAARTA